MEIKQIKQKLSILKVLHHYNLIPDKNNMLRCPFHNDKTPSMKIYPETNTWTCFSSSCEAGTGDQIEMIQRQDKLNKHQAILKAASMVNGSDSIAISPENIVKSSENTATSIDYLKMFTSFKQGIIRSPKAKDYAEKRHLDINRLDIGYNSGKTNKQMKHCLIFPLKNRSGEITSFYGRSILDKENAKHYYTAGRTGLYPAYPKPETETLILTESIIDTATLIQHKDRLPSKAEVLTLYGTNGLTDEHTKAIKQVRNLKEIILFFDGDKPGIKATEKYTKELKALTNLKISTVQTPENEDINSLTRPKIGLHKKV